ncbi:unnamed protein product [Alopecurus aequalis]
MRETKPEVPAATKTKAAAAAPAANNMKAAAAAPNRCASDGAVAGRSARDGGSGGGLISDLPDDILGTIVSLLPTKDGARSQAIARRWRPIWRSAPLNLQADYNLCLDESKQPSIVSKILSDHNGTARRFIYDFILVQNAKSIEAWFHSLSLANLQELDINFQHLDYSYDREKRYPLPPSVLLCASTLVVAKISFCCFPKKTSPSPRFPLLKQLNLWHVSISEDVFHGVLSCCHVLESLDLLAIGDVGCFHISSPTLRSVRLCSCLSRKGELVIEDSPRLDRLLLSCPREGRETIRVSGAPKLEILGPLSPHTSKIEIANQVFKSLIPTNLSCTINTVKVLALGCSVPNLNVVIDVLRCFPYLEKLYVIWAKYFETRVQNGREYDLLDPVKCLETHLKKLVLTNYEGGEQDVGFSKFFVSNAKVLKEIKFRVSKKINKEWVADPYRLLEVGNRASRDAKLKFIRSTSKFLDAHDLSSADPFSYYIFNEVDALSGESY